MTYITAERQAELDRLTQIDQDPIAKAILAAIESLPHARRLYPDTYAQLVAEEVRKVVS